MPELFPEHLRKYFHPEQIDFVRFEYPSDKACILQNGLIIVGYDCLIEDQIICFFHEIMHMHPDFIIYTKSLWNNESKRDRRIEREIEEYAQRLYRERLDLVEAARKTLLEARVLSDAIEQRVEKLRKKIDEK